MSPLRFLLLVASLLSLSAAAEPRYRLISLRSAGITLASGINSRGDIVGRVVEGGRPRSFLMRDGIVTILPDLTPSNGNSTAISINEQGEVAGVSYAPVAPPFTGTSSHAFYWSAQTGIVNLTPETPGLSLANAINNRGETVGYVMQGNQSGALLWRVQRDGSVLTERVTPASAYTADAYDVNDNGLVVGSMMLVPYVYDARSGARTELPLPRTQGEALSVNNLDQIAGFVIDFQNAHRVTVWNRGTDGAWRAEDVGVLPFPHGYCKPYAINNRGQLVGTCLAEGPVPPEAWVTVKGELTPVKDLIDPAIAAHWQFYDAYDVNDAGVVVGAGLEDGQPAGFMLVPLPSPKRRAVRK